MALVRSIEPITKERQRVHEETTCSYSIVREGSRRYIQLDTYGSPERKLAGKISQSLQLDETAAAQLKRIIEDTFPQLRAGQL